MRQFLTALSLCGALFTFSYGQPVITVHDVDIGVGDTVTWTSNNVYLLDGLVFIDSAAVLNIQAGTVVKAKQPPTTADNTSALIVARRGKLYAMGTAQQPIIFTAESDSIGDPNDLGPTDRGLWGGVILLGRGVINTASGVGQIEGIPTTEPRGAYGGTDDNDDSGALRYVSIRHGGFEIGAGNEINGLTLGGVGRGTTLEYIEVYANLDDGFEWFGGTASTKYIVSAFCGDDAFDYDEGWRGKNQFWLAIVGTDQAGRIAEQDGGTTPEDGTPYAIPIIYNASYIGPGVTALPQGDGAEALIFRDNAGGKYYNSIITDYNGQNGGAAVTVEDLASGHDSRERLETGDLVLNTNIWWAFGAGTDTTQVFPQAFVRTHVFANNNRIVNPELLSISRTNNGLLDPRPSPTGPAATGASTPSDTFFTTTAYFGAFDPNGLLWINGWTALSNDGFTDVAVYESGVPTTFALDQNYPNPFNPSTDIRYRITEAGHVTLTVFNLLGQEVATLVNEVNQPGVYRVGFDGSRLGSGVYFYRLSSRGVVQVRKMVLMK